MRLLLMMLLLLLLLAQPEAVVHAGTDAKRVGASIASVPIRDAFARRWRRGHLETVDDASVDRVGLQRRGSALVLVTAHCRGRQVVSTAEWRHRRRRRSSGSVAARRRQLEPVVAVRSAAESVMEAADVQAVHVMVTLVVRLERGG